MGSSLAFKITATVVKPTRESLLDYCAYVMITLSLIGVARVWISGSSLRDECGVENIPQPRTTPVRRGSVFEGVDKEDISGDFHDGTVKVLTVSHANTRNPPTDRTELITNSGNDTERNYEKKESRYGLVLDGDYNGDNISEVENVTVAALCPKYYQATFAYVLLIESIIQLFVGLLWAKVPKVSHTLAIFTELVQDCQKSDWAKRALNVVTGKSTISDVSQSLYSFMSSEFVNHDMRSLLDTLFHPDNDYRAKSKARLLYESVQTFCEKHSGLTDIWMTYIIKSLIQFLWWILILNVNLVLFVMLEFYVVCSDELNVPCDHDTFLRIIWFMGESVLFVYGVFICKTLKWLNEKSVLRHGTCSCLTFRNVSGRARYNKPDTGPLIKCKIYRFGSNIPVYNDTAIMLHLLEEAHPRLLPYFVVFMFSEWKEKLTSFANPVQLSETPLRSSMQMLSGRIPPLIEITDISMNGEVPKSYSTTSIKSETKKKSKAAVTFYLEEDTTSSDENAKKADSIASPNGRSSEDTSSPEATDRSIPKAMVQLPPPNSSPNLPASRAGHTPTPNPTGAGLGLTKPPITFQRQASGHEDSPKSMVQLPPPKPSPNLRRCHDGHMPDASPAAVVFGLADAPITFQRHMPEHEETKKQLIVTLGDAATKDGHHYSTVSSVVDETSALVHSSSSAESLTCSDKHAVDFGETSCTSETQMLLES